MFIYRKTACKFFDAKFVLDLDFGDTALSALPRARGPPKARQSVAEPVAQKGSIGGGPKPVEMRRIGDAAWRYFASRTDAAKAFGVTTNDVGYLLREPSKASRYACEFEARPAPAPKKRERPTYRSVEGAKPKTNGKWRSGLFPGREFDDLDEYRAAKKQREERREEYRAQARDNRCHAH